MRKRVQNESFGLFFMQKGDFFAYMQNLSYLCTLFMSVNK